MFVCLAVWILGFDMYIYFEENCVIKFNNPSLKEIQAHDKQLGNSLSTKLTFLRTMWLGLHKLGSFQKFYVHCSFVCKFSH